MLRFMVQDFITGPHVLRRASRWCFVLACVCATGAIVLANNPSRIPWKRTPWHRASIMVLGLAPLAIIYPIGYLTQRRVRRAWHRSGGRLCAHCGYELLALGDAGRCPECGRAFDLRSDAAIWKQAHFNVPAGHPAHPAAPASNAGQA